MAIGRVMIHSSHTSGFRLPHAGGRVPLHTTLAASRHMAVLDSINGSGNCAEMNVWYVKQVLRSTYITEATGVGNCGVMSVW
jgi:hypothetical protein